MSKPLIELITCESSNWSVLSMNLGEDFIFGGHSIPNHIWIDLLNILGYKVETKKITDEDMENNNLLSIVPDFYKNTYK